jgi:hypothetical protein
MKRAKQDLRRRPPRSDAWRTDTLELADLTWHEGMRRVHLELRRHLLTSHSPDTTHEIVEHFISRLPTPYCYAVAIFTPMPDGAVDVRLSLPPLYQ